MIKVFYKVERINYEFRAFLITNIFLYSILIM
jgi:hypothetical protein